MIPLYLNQSAHIIDQICESDVECRPHHSDSSEKQSLHALLREAIDMFDAFAVGNNITSLRATILYLDVEQLFHGIGVAVKLALRKLLATPKMRLKTMLYLFERNRPSIIDGRHEPHIAVDKSCGTHNGQNFR